MKKNAIKLRLNRETVCALQLDHAAGGTGYTTQPDTCVANCTSASRCVACVS